jgi:hypothetical protein
MSISEAQLDIWAKQGSVTQSAETYQTIRQTLQRPDAPYAERTHNIFLQGSYGNDTNIYADSDVDVVIMLTSVYYADTDELPESDAAAYAKGFSAAQYSWTEFRTDVSAHLSEIYGTAVKHGNGGRRDVDVLPAAEFRRYFAYTSANNQRHAEGICFWLPDGTRIVNYPKQHSANLTAKHQQTRSWLKPTVRILKNMRNAMIAKGLISSDLAPSYYLEGMLYNVPANVFGTSYVDTIAGALNWLRACDRSALTCANELYMLLHPSSPVTWRAELLQKYLDETVSYWNTGG